MNITSIQVISFRPNTLSCSIHLIVVSEENLGLVCNTSMVFSQNLENLKFSITRAQFIFF